ncbi:hypothetical protein DFP93_102298 [Aneurinibacillus soli]|uniref:Uncharacterized protein n=1 Tax=Aneurinibacillus soli TaxID=1500254 RepID=A0A0U5AZM1_9BACL|nr:hypothetical protein [Aneurinibacillus soli]PYE63611.1 hypothetical protein DFP93_102298 [Aneurinibacillus soli]BAU27456.1 hypothetical protein CB4_01630 [Aneurinibacillus soli]
MHVYDQIEYSDVVLWFDEFQIHSLIAHMTAQGMKVAWKETSRYFSLSVTTDSQRHRLIFRRIGKKYRMRDRHYNILDPNFEKILYYFIEQARGHAVVKIYSGGQLMVQRIRYGEAEQIIKINGSLREIVFEKACSVSMEDVKMALQRRDAEERIPELVQEVDAELDCLSQALAEDDTTEAERAKARLAELRHEMLLLEV